MYWSKVLHNLKLVQNWYGKEKLEREMLTPKLTPHEGGSKSHIKSAWEYIWLFDQLY